MESKNICTYVENAKGTSLSRLYVALTKTSPTSTVIASSIYSCVLSVGLDSNSSRLDLLGVDTSPVVVIMTQHPQSSYGLA